MGQWTCQGANGVLTMMMFGPDGAYVRSDQAIDGSGSYGSGTWSVDGSQLHYQISGQTCLPPEMADVGTLGCMPLNVPDGTDFISSIDQKSMQIGGVTCLRVTAESMQMAQQMNAMGSSGGGSTAGMPDYERRNQIDRAQRLLNGMEENREHASPIMQPEYDQMIAKQREHLQNLESGE